ncbi:MAG TPA: VWA domain-containing protein [Thermoanaerobaculia bacterium]|jgi:VWFA-related protein|nr:VWA domain-containing protein [Thermoanaerobaculia bacterium]
MRQSSAVIILACLTLAAAPELPAGAQTAAGREFGERIEVNTVNVEVHVTDRNGKPVTGLQRGDFTLFEDGKPMAIANFDAMAYQAVATPGVPAAPAVPAVLAAESAKAPRDPASWVIFVDDVFIHPAHRARALGQLRTFLTTELIAGDQVMLATYDHGLHIRLPFSSDRAALGRALDATEKLVGNGNELDRARREALQRVFQDLDLSDVGGKPDQITRGKGLAKEQQDDSGGGGGTSQCPINVSEPVKTYAAAVRHEVLSSVSALTVLINSLSGIPGRKVLLHISDGIPLNPAEDMFQVLFQICGGGAATSGLTASSGVPLFSGGGSTLSAGYQGSQAALDAQAFSTAKDWTTLTAHANAQRVTLYTLQASGAEAAGTSADTGPEDRVLSLPEVASIESSNRQQPLSEMASDTGGKAIFWANDIRPELVHIQEDLATYYSLGFNPPHLGDSREHHITVKVKQPGMTVRYRQSYRDKPALERAVDHTLASLYYGYQDNPLDVQLEVGDMVPDGKGNWAVPFRLRIPLYKVTMQQTETSFEGKVQLLVASQTDGKKTPLRQVEVPIKIPRLSALTALGQYYQYEVKLTLEPGEQNVAIAVRDEASTTTSFLARTLQLGVPVQPAASAR